MAAPIGRQLFTRYARISSQRSFQTSATLMASHDAEFNKAKERLNTLKEDPGNDVKLQMYALFKQATVGQCNAPKPGMMDIVGKYKWNAWNDLGKMSQDEAQLKYIELVDTLAGSEDSSASSSSPSPGDKPQYETLAVTRDNGIYAITLNRPNKKNALNMQMYEELVSALKESADDPSIVVATVTGSGDYYCSGNDLSNFMNIPPDGVAAMALEAKRILERFVSAFIDYPKPLIALVNGPAVGVSVTVLGLFDAVYASDRATFHTPFTKLGQSAEGCSSYTFPRLMGMAKASELLLFNKKISAAEAFNRNLVTEVIPENLFVKETAAKIQAYAQLPKQSLQKSKALVSGGLKEKLHEVNNAECDLLEERWQSQECMDAIMGFFSQKSSKL